MKEIELPNSPVTGNRSVRPYDSLNISDIVRLYRDQEGIDVGKYFEHGKKAHILECADVGYRFYYPFEMAGDETFYQEIGAKAAAAGSDYDRDWSDDHEIARAYIRPADRLLEIGCNSGKFLERIVKSTMNVQGLEFNSIAANAARQKGLKVSGASIEVYSNEHPGTFDVVCAFQVLEHVTTAGSFIRSSLRALRPGGRLIFSVPNNDPFFQRFNKFEVMNLPPHHVGLWNLGAFQALPNFFEMDLIGHGYSGAASFRGDCYLRARNLASITSLPRRHSMSEKIKILAVAPLALLASSWDYFKRKGNFGHITVVFKKREA